MQESGTSLSTTRASAAATSTARRNVPWADMSSSEDEMWEPRVDNTACRAYMRQLLDNDTFRGTLHKTKQAMRMTMQERLVLHQRGQMPAAQVWGLPPAFRRQQGDPPRKKDLHHEPPYMLDVASLPVHAVYHAKPPCIDAWVAANPNPRTKTGKYRPIERWTRVPERLHYICMTYREWHRSEHRCLRQLNRRGCTEPMYEYLPMRLVAKVVRELIQEFQCRQRDFGDPFPDAKKLVVPADEIATWEHYAIRGVQEMLDLERIDLQREAAI